MSLARPALVLLAILLTRGAPARGAWRQATEADGDQKAAASAHLKRGAELIDAEDLKGALIEFEAAYRLVPNPSILHNFGVVYQGLGRYAEALDAFERFLAEASRPPAAVRERAVDAVRSLREQVGVLKIVSSETGADILVDGHRIGQTPWERPIYLDPGTHAVSLERPGGGTVVAERLEVTAGQRLTVPAPRAESPLPPPPVERERAPALSTGTGGGQRTAAWVVTTGAVVATGVLATELVIRLLDVRAFNRLGCGTTYEDKGGRDCASKLEGWQRAGTGVLVSGVAAAVLGAGAAALFWTLPHKPVDLSLRASPAEVGLRLQGRF